MINKFMINSSWILIIQFFFGYVDKTADNIIVDIRMLSCHWP